jgi:hypothetical protein
MSAILYWDANTEPDLAGYRTYRGWQSRNYIEQRTLGKITSVRYDSLDATRRHYFAVTAYDLSGNESTFSEEVIAELTNPPDQGEPPPGCLISTDTTLAVDLVLDNYERTTARTPAGSGTPVVKMIRGDLTTGSVSGNACYAGIFDVLVNVQHDSDAVETFTLHVNGLRIADRVTGDKDDNWKELRWPSVAVNLDDEIKILAIRGKGAYARIWYMRFLER